MTHLIDVLFPVPISDLRIAVYAAVPFALFLILVSLILSMGQPTTRRSVRNHPAQVDDSDTWGDAA
jgi:hypothetical protein